MSLSAFEQHGGDLEISDTTEQAYLLEYQTVTSHGHETVSDNASETHVAHSPGVTILTPPAWNVNKDDTKEGRVHVPIHNPPGITTSWTLKALDVNFDSEESATVEKITLYYDGDLVVSASTRTSNKFHIDFTTTEAKKYSYVRPKGISIALEFAFPKAKSAIKLYSITLAYQAT